MQVIHSDDELQAAAASLRRSEGLGGVLVPTMGALHEGHAALIRRGADLARERGLPAGCVVSVFVNPTQFNDPADFSRYPRTLDADVDLCERSGASLLFAPDPQTVYPPGRSIPVPPLPAVATTPGLEEAHRPGHFAGVCQVVLRLFTLLQPASAVFGEKDWQQLQVIRAMAAQRRLALEIVAVPTVRSPEGLALSSRNALLSRDDLRRALALHDALLAADRQPDPGGAEGVMRDVLAQAGLDPEYAVVRNAATLAPVTGRDGACRALIAARVGAVRLIDNAAWGEHPL